jgi:hypothetical protein
MFGFPFPGLSSTSIAEEATITWNPNSEADLDGYTVYWSLVSPGPPHELVVKLSLDEFADPNNLEFTLNHLEAGKKYYIAVSAFDKAGNESQYSREICVKIEGGSIIDYRPHVGNRFRSAAGM